MNTLRLKTMLIVVALIVSGTASAQNPPQDFGAGNAHDRAMAALGQRDYQTAYAIFSDMARRGDADGLFHLGVMHAQGQGVPQDPREAYARLYVAAGMGHTSAAQYARQLEAAFPQTDFVAVRRQVERQNTGRGTASPPRPRRASAPPRTVRPHRPPGATPPGRQQ